MHILDEKINDLKQQISDKSSLNIELKQLQEKRDKLLETMTMLEEERKKEQLDVKRLERIGFTNLFYTVIGRKKKKLDKERREADEVNARYDERFKELEIINCNLSKCESGLKTIEKCEKQYEELIQQKIKIIKLNDISERQEILKIEEELAFIDSQISNIEEAVEIVWPVCDVLKKLETKLEKELEKQGGNRKNTGNIYYVSDDYYFFDDQLWASLVGIILGSIFCATLEVLNIEEYNANKAREYAEQFRTELRKVKAEFVEVTKNIKCDMNTEIDEFIKYMDSLVENILCDLIAQDITYSELKRIRKAINTLECLTDKFMSVKEENLKMKYKANMAIEGITIRTVL